MYEALLSAAALSFALTGLVLAVAIARRLLEPAPDIYTTINILLVITFAAGALVMGWQGAWVVSLMLALSATLMAAAEHTRREQRRIEHAQDFTEWWNEYQESKNSTPSD